MWQNTSTYWGSYKGCEYYLNLIKGYNTFRNNTQHTPPINTNIWTNSIQHIANSQEKGSCTDETKINKNLVENTAITLTKVLD